MTAQEKVVLHFENYERAILNKAYDFADDNLDMELPEKVYSLLDELKQIVSQLLAMESTDN